MLVEEHHVEPVQLRNTHLLFGDLLPLDELMPLHVRKQRREPRPDRARLHSPIGHGAPLNDKQAGNLSNV